MSRTQNKSLMSLNKYTTLISTYTIYIRITQLQLTYINNFFKNYNKIRLLAQRYYTPCIVYYTTKPVYNSDQYINIIAVQLRNSTKQW